MGAVGVAALAGVGVGEIRAWGLARRLKAAERAATTDPLTKLANRAGLERDFARLVARPKSGELVVLVLLDLNDFKLINDTYGHAGGDRFLVGVAGRLARLRAPARLVCASRLGGDEFVLVFASVTRDPKALLASVTRTVGAAMDLPVSAGTAWLHPRASLGAACSRASCSRLYDLLAAADKAMYRVKRRVDDELPGVEHLASSVITALRLPPPAGEPRLAGSSGQPS